MIELLVVVAIIALLISILLPSLKCAKEQARASVCGTTLRGLGTGLSGYASEHNDYIPGINTSGVALRALNPPGGSASLPHLRRAGMPVQTFDWMTPILRYDTEMGSIRSDRFKILVNRYRCPSQASIRAVLYDDNRGSVPDFNEFERGEQNWSALSYLMPAFFQYWGQREASIVLTTTTLVPGIPVRAIPADDRWEVLVPTYRSRLDKVGTAARKLAAADGTRYLDDSRVLDFDIYPFATTFGSFTSGGGWWSGDTAWGVGSGGNWDGTALSRFSPSQGENLGLSYRHGCDRVTGPRTSCQSNKGSMNGLFFDGHVSRMGDRASRELEYWYPKGSVVQNPGEGMTRAQAGDVIP